MGTEQIWNLERSFWLEGATAYEANLHDEAVMVFPGLGILRPPSDHRKHSTRRTLE